MSLEIWGKLSLLCQKIDLHNFYTLGWSWNYIKFIVHGEAPYSQKQDWELTVAQIMNSLLQIQT